MRNRRGVIDQTITSVIVIVVAVFLSVLFVIVSNNIALIKGTGAEMSYSDEVGSGQSRAVLEAFIGEKIRVDGDELSVKDALGNFQSNFGTLGNGRDEWQRQLTPIERVFGEKYGCGEKNKMVFIIPPASGSGVHSVYLHYPERRWGSGGEGLPVSVRIESPHTRLVREGIDPRSDEGARQLEELGKYSADEHAFPLNDADIGYGFYSIDIGSAVLGVKAEAIC